LRIQSSAKSRHHTPSYRPGDEIVGFLELDLPREKSITGIQVALRGYTTFADSGPPKTTFPSPVYLAPAMCTKPLITFLDFKTTLWKPSMGDPRSTSPTPVDATTCRPVNGHSRRKSLAPKEFKEKLLGSYSFPFLFTLPHEVDNEPLPPDLSNSHGETPVLIKYEMEVVIQTALFKADAMILCPFHVAPRSIPPLPSPSRELIYTCIVDSPDAQLMPPGPEQDSDGWVSSKTVRLGDTSCVMSLATPLIYTRGTPIHIHMKFTSATVDPSTIRIALVRTIWASDGSVRSQKRSGSPSGLVTRACIASAVCYNLPQDETVAHGEIKVPKDLSPEFEFKGTRAEYHVLLFPSTSSCASYLNLNLNIQPLHSVPVKIGTGLPYSPESRIVPLSFLPPNLASTSSSTRSTPGGDTRRTTPEVSRLASSRGRHSKDSPTGTRMDALETLLNNGNPWSTW